MSYEGSINARAQVGTGGICIGQDKKSVASFGTLRENSLAVTCTERHLIKGKMAHQVVRHNDQQGPLQVDHSPTGPFL